MLDVNFWLRGLYGVGIGFGILGLMQFFLYPDLRNLMYLGWDPHYYRLFSTLLDPNFVGIILVLTLILGCGLWKKKQKNFFLMIGQLIGFVSLLLTYSRSSYVSFAMAVVCLAAWTKQWKVVIALALFAGALRNQLFQPITKRAPGRRKHQRELVAAILRQYSQSGA